MFNYTKILFIVNPFHKDSHPVFLKTLVTLQSKKLKGYLEKIVFDKLSDSDSFGGYDEIKEIEIEQIEVLTKKHDVELAIGFGGDGTILHFSKLYHDSSSPTPDLLSFNYGSLGYMGSFEIEDVSYVLKNIFGWEFEKLKQDDQNPEPEGLGIDKLNRQRLGIKVQKADGDTFELSSFHFEGGKIREKGTTEFHALNEVNLTSSRVLKTVKLEVSINGKYLTTYEGSGLVFSTPTGSTSYNLSLHGAIIQNDIDCIGIIGVGNTASISMKPLILPSDVIITVKNLTEDTEGPSNGVGDGSLIFEFGYGDIITISGGKSYIPQLMRTSRDPVKDWVSRLKSKLSLFEY